MTGFLNPTFCEFINFFDSKVPVKDEMFQELLQSVREAGAIMRGEMHPSRVFVVEAPDVKSIRSKLGVSQPEFAAMLGISVRILENWEQKRRVPKGPAKVLLKVAEAHPEAIWEVVKPKRKVTGLAPRRRSSWIVINRHSLPV